eukprot:15453852-Alexandrium_andersonii.AAC.1
MLRPRKRPKQPACLTGAPPSSPLRPTASSAPGAAQGRPQCRARDAVALATTLRPVFAAAFTFPRTASRAPRARTSASAVPGEAAPRGRARRGPFCFLRGPEQAEISNGAGARKPPRRERTRGAAL